MMMQRNPFPRPKSPHPGAALHNRPGGFMAEDARRRHRAVLDFLDVGRADAAHRHPDQQLARADARNGHRLDAQVVRAAIDYRPHRFRYREHGRILTQSCKDA